MPKTLPALEPVARIHARYARMTRGAVPGCDLAGLPVPVPGLDGVRIAILFTATEREPQTGARRVQAPRHLVSARADTGDFVELRAITPRDLGVPQDPEAWIGELPEGDRGEKRARLLDLYDAALPAFAAGPSGATATAKRAAIEIAALFPEVAEAPLVPYYRALGRRFFAWVDRAAAS